MPESKGKKGEPRKRKTNRTSRRISVEFALDLLERTRFCNMQTYTRKRRRRSLGFCEYKQRTLHHGAKNRTTTIRSRSPPTTLLYSSNVLTIFTFLGSLDSLSTVVLPVDFFRPPFTISLMRSSNDLGWLSISEAELKFKTEFVDCTVEVGNRGDSGIPDSDVPCRW